MACGLGQAQVIAAAGEVDVDGRDLALLDLQAVAVTMGMQALQDELAVLDECQGAGIAPDHGIDQTSDARVVGAQLDGDLVFRGHGHEFGIDHVDAAVALLEEDADLGTVGAVAMDHGVLRGPGRPAG